MFGRRFFGGRYYGARFFGDGGTVVAVDGSYNGSRYFGPRYFGPRFFSTNEGPPLPGGASEIAPQPTGELSHAWKLDPGWAAIWGPTQYGIPEANRDSIYAASTGAIAYVKPRIVAGTVAVRSTGAVVYVKPQAIAAASNAGARQTGAVVFVRPQPISVTSRKLTQTGAVAYVAVRAQTGVVQTQVPSLAQALEDLQQLFPRQSQKVVNPDGSMTIEWYRFLDKATNGFFRVLTDVVSELQNQVNATMMIEARQVSLSQQTQSVAESLNAAVQVLQTNSIPGAEQIPQPQTTQEN